MFRWLPRLLMGLIWLWVIRITLYFINRDATIPNPSTSYLYDWHVYAAGARDLAEGTLYQMPLLAPWPIPVEAFNQPPLAAWWALLLLPFGEDTAGTIWQLLNSGALFVSAVLACRLVGVWWGWGGVAVAVYFRLFPMFYEAGVQLANNAWLLLGMVMAFAYAHRRRHDMAAGVLLGLAIATKLWPVMLLAVPLRERRWHEMAAAVTVLAAQSAAFLVWLGGPSIIPFGVEALRYRVPVEVEVFWISAVRETFDWWPWWGGVMIAGLLVAVPARGRLAIGLAMLAGVSIVANVWHHYLPTLFIALALIMRDLLAPRIVAPRSYLARLRQSRAGSAPSPPTSADGA